MRDSVRSLVAAALACCVVLLATIPVTGCSGKQDGPQPVGTAPAASDAAGEEPLPPLA
ncbi:MAG: hypothetical protein AB7T20_12425 [Steroidobacteraceae bacterium]